MFLTVKKSKLVATSAVIAPVLALINIINPKVFHTLQFLFAFTLTISCLIIRCYGFATYLLTLAGIINSFFSQLSLLILPIWIVRGITLDSILWITRTFSDHIKATKFILSMILSSLITALTFYVVYIKIFKLVPEPPFILVMFIISFAILQTFIGSYIGVKVYYKFFIERG